MLNPINFKTKINDFWNIQKNKRLCKKYPFLAPRSLPSYKTYDYSWTWLDMVPKGWQSLFLQTCKSLYVLLKKYQQLDTFNFIDIKEKYSRMVIYYEGTQSPEIYNLFENACKTTKTICYNCGNLKQDGQWMCEQCTKLKCNVLN